MIRKIRIPEATKILGTTSRDWFNAAGTTITEEGAFIVIRRPGTENQGKRCRVPAAMCIIEEDEPVEVAEPKKKKGEAA